MNYGFVFKPSEEGEWHVGQGVATKRFGAGELIPNGHGWGKYLPKAERQNNGLETQACTIYGSLNALETLANFKGYKDFPQNCSERFSAIMADVTPNGNDPQKSCEAIRRWGVIPESVLPFDETIKSWPNYYHPKPMEEAFIALGESFLKKYTIGHEYVFNGATGITPKADRLISALARGTVCVSVHAWKTNEHGNYYKNPQDGDNHWVQLVDYKMGDYWIIRDTYAPFEKRVEWDTNFQTAKLFFLTVNESGLTPNKADFFALTLKWILDKLKKIMPSQDHITEIPLSEKYPEPLMPTKSQKLYDIAYSCIGIDMAPLNDAFGCAEALSHVLMKAGVPDMHHPYVGTADLDRWLRDHLTTVETPEKGDIAMFPTGTGNGKVRGHCFVVGEHTWMSNNSQSGKWDYHWTGVDAIKYYEVFGGIKARYYRWV